MKLFDLEGGAADDNDDHYKPEEKDYKWPFMKIEKASHGIASIFFYTIFFAKIYLIDGLDSYQFMQKQYPSMYNWLCFNIVFLSMSFILSLIMHNVKWTEKVENIFIKCTVFNYLLPCIYSFCLFFKFFGEESDKYFVNEDAFIWH